MNSHPRTAPASAPSPTADALLWHDGLLLGYAPMDAIHEEFVQHVQALLEADERQLPVLLDQLIDHAKHHFGEEDLWMTETDFPARQCHINEHAAVMQSMHEVRQLLLSGNTQVCRRLGSELAQWFPGHADYLDAALAHWMCKQRLGGKPVVLRRQLAPGKNL